MNVGIPGTGIGGLFYITAALIAPCRRRAQKRRCGVPQPFLISLGVLAGIFATGWLLGILLGPVAQSQSSPENGTLAHAETANLVRWASLLGSILLLAAVLIGVQIARVLHRWMAPTNMPKRLSFWTIVFLAGASTALGQTKVDDLMRRADTAFQDEDRNLARTLYLQVIDLKPEQSRAIYRLGQLAADDETALGWFERYTSLEPEDAWGWIAAGDKCLRLGKSAEARSAFQRAAKLAPNAEEIPPKLEKARLRAAPVLEPLGAVSGDSDGNRAWKFGLSGDVAIRYGMRIGAVAARTRISDGSVDAFVNEGSFQLQGRPRAALRLKLSGGAIRLRRVGDAAWTTPGADAQVRWNSPSGGAFDVRMQRLPLGTTPLLVDNRAMRSELRLGGTVPVGPVRLRLGARGAEIQTAVEPGNRRLQADGAFVFPVGWRGEFSAQYHRIGFQRASTAGYFAPRTVETVEGGTYWQLGGDGRWSAEVDLGVGMQRVAIQGQPVGSWKPALRAWGMAIVDVTRNVAIKAEVEGYSAPFAPAGVSTAPDWRYAALNFSLVFRIY